MSVPVLVSPGHRFWPVGEAAQANYEAVPRVTYTDPQAAAVGAGQRQRPLAQLDADFTVLDPPELRERVTAIAGLPAYRQRHHWFLRLTRILAAKKEGDVAWRSWPVEKRLEHALVAGDRTPSRRPQATARTIPQLGDRATAPVDDPDRAVAGVMSSYESRPASVPAAIVSTYTDCRPSALAIEMTLGTSSLVTVRSRTTLSRAIFSGS